MREKEAKQRRAGKRGENREDGEADEEVAVYCCSHAFLMRTHGKVRDAGCVGRGLRCTYTADRPERKDVFPLREKREGWTGGRPQRGSAGPGYP